MNSNFEALEPRVLLSHAALDTQVFYPEGFAHAGVTEVVSISNLGAEAVEFELVARYEIGERDQVLASGVLNANGSRDITIADMGVLLVRPDEPYALELRSEARLGAVLRHDDFGGAAAGRFTGETSEQWAFPNVTKDNASRDFIVFYNPGEGEVTVTVTGFGANGMVFELVSTLESMRRGGWNLANEPGVPEGGFGVRVSSSAPIVAAMSHYAPGRGNAFTNLGEENGGATGGVIFDVEFSERGRGMGRIAGSAGSAGSAGNAGNEPGLVSDSTISIFNSGENVAEVRLVFFNRDESQPLTNNIRMVTIDGGERITFDLDEMQFPEEANVSLVYESDEPVSVGATVTRKNQSFGISSALSAATEWEFTNPVLNNIQNGVLRTEDLFVFNPTDQAFDVKIEYFYANGESRTETISLNPLEFGEIDATLLPPSLGEGRPFFGIRVTSSVPVSVGLEYWARENKEVFNLSGLASGDIVRLSEVLVLS